MWVICKNVELHCTVANNNYTLEKFKRTQINQQKIFKMYMIKKRISELVN